MAQKIIGEVVSCGSYPGAKVRCCLEVEMIDNGAKVKCRWRPFGEHWNGYGSSATLAVSHTTAGPRKEVTATSQISYVSNDWREAYAPKIGWQEKSITKGTQTSFTVSAYYREVGPNSDVSYTFKLPNKGTYTWKFNANGGSKCDPVTHNAGEETMLPVTLRPGYKFKGWKYGNIVYPGGPIPCTLDADATFIAQWEIAIVDCTIYKNDGTQDYEVKQKMTANPMNLPKWTRDGYSLLGFTDNPNGTGELYKDEYKKEQSFDFSLYAKWGELAEYPVIHITDIYRCNYNGGRDNEGTGWRIKFSWQQLFKLGSTTYDGNYKLEYEVYDATSKVDYGTKTITSSSQSIYEAGGLSPSKTYRIEFKLYEENHRDYFTQFNATLGTSAQPLDFYAIGSKVKVGINATASESDYEADVKLGGWVDAETKLSIGGIDIFDLIYPVGCYYWSSDSTNPETMFGGSWERIRDKFVYAAGSYSAGDTGGEETHKLTLDEMPAHAHDVYNGNSIPSSDGAYAGLYQTNVQSGTGWHVYSNGKNGEKHLITTAKGGFSAHNNMPPYIVAYCWHRIG